MPSDRHARRQEARTQRLIDDIVATAQQLASSGANIGELKIVARALEEMRGGFEMFAPYRGVRKVAAFGSARTLANDPYFRVAERFARAIADAGYMVITGAGGGIMEACQRGAGRERSFGVNIRLPFEQYANPIIHGDPKLRSFNYFFTRKLFFIKEAHAIALFPGGFGTHDEGFEALTLIQTGKCQMMPVVLLDQPRGTYWKTWQRYVEEHLLRRGMISPEDLHLYLVTDDCERAMAEITHFYRNYHSARYVEDLLVVRTNTPLPNPLLLELAAEFSDILVAGGIEPCTPFAVERDDPSTLHLPRVCFRFDRRHYGRLRMLIDRINAVDLPPP
ncbi:MAG: LOG family protein [Deltaproteobacteria bacterium]|nr:LOG family protein [Deltaproteobacteria bacterium]